MFSRIARFSVVRSFGFGLLASGIFAVAPALAAPGDEGNQSAVTAVAQANSPASPAARRNEPGQFDFYILALSWSPSFCEASRERATARRPDPQCGARPYSFVVHGLWPQHERGFPSNCQVPAPRVDRNLVDSMLDLMPSPRLVFHEWDRHGTCSGLSAADYFATIRKARAEIKIPSEYQSLSEPLTVSPAQIADAFVKANPGLRREALAVTCSGKRLSGVRICLSKELSIRDCANAARNSCRSETVVMPPVRGPHAASSR